MLGFLLSLKECLLNEQHVHHTCVNTPHTASWILQFSVLAALWNHLRSLKSIEARSSLLDADLIGLGGDSGFGCLRIPKVTPCVCNSGSQDHLEDALKAGFWALPRVSHTAVLLWDSGTGTPCSR